MHKRGIIRYANYTVCASVFIHFCMQRKNNETIPIIISENATRNACIDHTQQKSEEVKMASHILHKTNFYLNLPLHIVQV